MNSIKTQIRNTNDGLQGMITDVKDKINSMSGDIGADVEKVHNL